MFLFKQCVMMTYEGVEGTAPTVWNLGRAEFLNGRSCR
jgi:hypothetical protein